MVELNTVCKWWDRLRVGLCKKFAAQGISVRPLPYDDLSEKEQEIVYNCWLDHQLYIRGN
jgi:hypothetical protein